MRRLPRLSATRVVIIIAVAAVGYFLFAATGDALLSQRLDREEQRLQHEIAELTRHQHELAGIRDYLRTDEYIEGVARRVLGLVRPGETLVIVTSSVTPTPGPEEPVAEDEARRWWEELYRP